MEIIQYVCGTMLVMAFGAFLFAWGFGTAMTQVDRATALDNLVKKFHEENGG